MGEEKPKPAEWASFENNEGCSCPADAENYLDDDLGIVKQALIPAVLVVLVLGLPLGFAFTGAVALLIVGFALLYRTMQVDYRCVTCRRIARPKNTGQEGAMKLLKQRYMLTASAMLAVGLAVVLVRAKQMVRPPEFPIPPHQQAGAAPQHVMEQMQAVQEQAARRRPPPSVPMERLPVGVPTSAAHGPDFTMPPPVDTTLNP